MFAVPTIISIAEYTIPLAIRDKKRGKLTYPTIITEIKLFLRAVRWAYDQDTEYDGLYAMAQRLLTLCGQCGVSAQSVLGGGRYINEDGYIVISNLGDGFPIVITQSDFQEDGISYNNTKLIGKNLIIEVDNLGWIDAGGGVGKGFNYTADGIIMRADTNAAIPGFDAKANNYTLRIWRKY